MYTNSDKAALTLSPRSFPPLPAPVTTRPDAADQFLYPGTPFEVPNSRYTQSPLPELASAPQQPQSKTPPPPVVTFPPGTQAMQDASKLQTLEEKIPYVKAATSIEDLNHRLISMAQIIGCTDGIVITTVFYYVEY